VPIFDSGSEQGLPDDASTAALGLGPGDPGLSFSDAFPPASNPPLRRARSAPASDLAPHTVNELVNGQFRILAPYRTSRVWWPLDTYSGRRYRVGPPNERHFADKKRLVQRCSSSRAA
jgi:hypothetical protein